LPGWGKNLRDPNSYLWLRGSGRQHLLQKGFRNEKDERLGANAGPTGITAKTRRERRRVWGQTKQQKRSRGSCREKIEAMRGLKGARSSALKLGFREKPRSGSTGVMDGKGGGNSGPVAESSMHRRNRHVVTFHCEPKKGRRGAAGFVRGN